MRNMLKFRETMLFGKSLMHTGMKVSNRSVIALVFLYPSCTHEESAILEEDAV